MNRAWKILHILNLLSSIVAVPYAAQADSKMGSSVLLEREERPGRPGNPGQPRPPGGGGGGGPVTPDPAEERRRREQDYRRGYERCERQEEHQARDRGYREGYSEGRINGRREGDNRGESDGRSRGHSEGRADGERRADSDADRAATPAGTARGISEAESSDASERGYADGLEAGDASARRDALNHDYPRGRRDYQNERLAEAIQNHDSFSQLPPRTSSETSGKNSSLNIQDGNLDVALTDAGDEQRGCADARRKDYSSDYRRGYYNGKDDGYREAYQDAYNYAYRSAYDYAFRRASEDAYRDNYDSAYRRHYEEARRAAYARRVNQLYDAAYEEAHDLKYRQVYPGYAAAQYQRGRVDEEKDFAERPVRLMEALATETIENGLYEPNEPLRIRFKLRNFSNREIQAQDLKIRIEARDDSSAVITQGEATPVRGLRVKSLTEISDALEFRLNESVADRVSELRVIGFFQGKQIGIETLRLQAQFMIKTEFAEALSFKDGLSTVVKLRLTNQSQKPTGGNLKIRFSAPADKLRIQNPEQSAPALNPGESQILEFAVVARATEDTLRLPMAFTVELPSSRRVGLLDRTEEVPVVNDYRVSLTTSTDGLAHPGVTRLYYKIVNTGSRLLYKGLQLKATFKDTDSPEAFKIIGPNPQFLMPLEKGETATFVVPVLVTQENSGGKIELEVLEDGRTVVIHDFEFKKTLN